METAFADVEHDAVDGCSTAVPAIGLAYAAGESFGQEENLEAAQQTDIELVVVDENGSKQPRLSTRLEG